MTGSSALLCQVYRSFSSLQPSTTWILHDLYIAEGGRRTVAGRVLVEADIDRARRAGACSVVLETQLTNASARAMYASLGLVEAGEEGRLVHYRLHLQLAG